MSGDAICSGDAVWVSGETGDSAILSDGGESRAVGEVHEGLDFLGVTCFATDLSSDICESGSCGDSDTSLVLLLMNKFGDSSRPDFPSSFCLSLRSLFLLSVSDNLGLSAFGEDMLMGLGKSDLRFSSSVDNFLLRSNGIYLVSDSKGIDLVTGFQEPELSGDVGELGVSISGDAGVIELSTKSCSCFPQFSSLCSCMKAGSFP